MTNLSETFGFDDDDLRLNHEGYISPCQKRRLKRTLFRDNLWIGVKTLFSSLFFVFLIGFGIWQWAEARWFFNTLIIVGIFGSVGFVWNGLSELRDSIRHTIHDLRDEQIERVSGNVFKHTVRGHNEFRIYWIVVQRERFDLNKSQYDLIKDETPYHLYYAPRTRRILSIEPVIRKVKEKTQNQPVDENALVRVFNFTDADLKANREGRMTNRQRAMLRKYQIIWLFNPGIVVIVLCFGGIGISLGARGEIFWMILFGFYMIFILVALWKAYAWDYWKDVRDGTVDCISGVASYSGNREDVIEGDVRHYLYIGDVAFLLSEAYLNAFTEGHSYLLYTATHSGEILSAECTEVSAVERSGGY